MDTDILTQDLTVKQVGGRAVGAERGGVVGEVRMGAAGPTRAGVSEGDAGAVCTLELGVTAGAVDHRDDCREESDEEHGGEGEGREHSEERVRACPMVSLPYPRVSSGVWSHCQADLQKHHTCLTPGLVLGWGCLGVLWQLWLGLPGCLMGTMAGAVWVSYGN